MSWMTTNQPPSWLVYISIGALIHIIVTVWGYPWYLRMRAARCASSQSHSTFGINTPKLCVLIAAHNEAHHIQRRLRNLRDQTYPTDAIRLILICDGCTDNTAELARQEGVDVIELTKHRGKSHALQTATDHLSDADIVVLTDARPLFAPDALVRLVTALHHPGVAAVSGVLNYNSQSMMLSPVGKYWQAEVGLRQDQSVVDGSTGLTGPICACWRRYLRGIPSGIVLDDVWLAIDIAAQGGRVAMCQDAIAWDDREYNPQMEWHRKVRTSAGNWQLVFNTSFWRILMRSGKVWHWTFHKLGRLLVPFCVLILCALAVTFWPAVALLPTMLVIIIAMRKPNLRQMLQLILSPVAGLVSLVAGRVDGRWKS